MSSQLPADLLTKPSLSTLAFVLRHRELWPEGFEWDYNDCEQCGMGMAFRLGLAARPSHETVGPSLDAVTEAFDLSEDAALKLFVYAQMDLPASHRSRRFVTPDHVATLIEQHLAGAAA